VWKQNRGVIFSKPAQDDYMKLKCYGTIPLPSRMGEVVEEVVADLLVQKGEKYELLSDGQYGSRERQSEIDAVAIMVGSQQAA
jgi:hypothetical protein